MLDGFDLGVGTLMPFLAKSETDKHTMYRAMGPFWNGNEVWLITAGGVTFAAFPTTYAVMFSGFYSALMLILFSLIFRGVAIEFRGMVDHPKWKNGWDICLTAGSFLPALLLGVAFANIFQGIPIDEAGIFRGNLLSLLNPYGLLGGLLFVAMFVLHGAIWLAVKTTGDLHDRAAGLSRKLWIGLAVVAVAFLTATWFYTRLYDNYLQNPLFYMVPTILIPLGALAALAMIRFHVAKAHWWKAWFSSSGLIVGVTLFGVVGLYPNLLPSNLNPAYSLTVNNSSSSPLTLKIMLVVAVIFVPIVIAYQSWVYRLFSTKVQPGDLLEEEAY